MRRPPLIRAAFAGFALLVFVATHWPRLRFDGPVERPDLYIHFAAFFLWTALLIACAFFGAALSARNILISSAIALAYSAADELSQGIPGLGRTVALDDWLANAAGVGAATAGALALGALRTRGPASR